MSVRASFRQFLDLSRLLLAAVVLADLAGAPADASAAPIACVQPSANRSTSNGEWNGAASPHESAALPKENAPLPHADTHHERSTTPAFHVLPTADATFRLEDADAARLTDRRSSLQILFCNWRK